MSAESRAYSILSGFAALGALVGDRIYPDALPEGCQYPAVVFARTETVDVTTISSVAVAEDVTVQFQTWADSRDAADSAADQVAAALRASGEITYGRTTAFDPEDGRFATMLSARMMV